MKKLDFTNIVAIVARGTKAQTLYQWELGDELIATIGPPTVGDNAFPVLEACSAELKRAGYEYDPTTLRQLRLIARVFPKDRRNLNLSFGVHADTRDPDTLDAIIAHAPKGQKIVQSYVRAQMQAREIAHQRELEKEKERRAHNAALARKEREKAEAEAAKANSPAARKAAQERARAAAQREKDNKTPPKRNEVHAAPSLEDMPALVAKAKFDVMLSQITGMVKELEDYALFFPTFSSTEVEVAVNDLLSVAEKARRIADQVRKHRANKRSHLQVVA